MTLDTIASMIFWNSSRKEEIRLAFVHADASPSIMASTSALMTGIICGMESSKNYIRQSFEMTGSGAERTKCGISRYPDNAENKAAPSEEA
mgnify:CR=1 FL=1